MTFGRPAGGAIPVPTPGTIYGAGHTATSARAVDHSPREARMDLSKLTTGDKVVAGSGIALFIISFFPWFGIDLGLADYSESGWSSIFSLLAILVGIAMVVVVLLPMFGVELPDLNMPWSQILFIAGIVCAALVVLQLLVGSSTAGVDLDRKIGVFLGVVAAAGLCVGGFMKRSEESAGGGASAAGPPTTF
jgi:hypothetical protein